MLNDIPRLKLMAGKLYDLVVSGHIENEWEENFINDMYWLLKRGLPLSEKQAARLETLFERY